MLNFGAACNIYFGQMSGHLFGNSCSLHLRNVLFVSAPDCLFVVPTLVCVWSRNFSLIAHFYLFTYFNVESKEPVTPDTMDKVCSEIGQEWRRFCRKMGFSDGECEQFRQDFHVSGVYEITYQVCGSLCIFLP